MPRPSEWALRSDDSYVGALVAALATHGRVIVSRSPEPGERWIAEYGEHTGSGLTLGAALVGLVGELARAAERSSAPPPMGGRIAMAGRMPQDED